MAGLFIFKYSQLKTFFSITSKNILDKVLVIIVFGFLLEFAITYKLWLPINRNFPLVNAIEFIPLKLGVLVNTILYILVIASLILMLFKSLRKISIYSFLVLLAVFILEDISRLQPWLFLHGFMLFIISLGTKHNREKAIIYSIYISIAASYFWAGFLKLNNSFATDIFPMLAEKWGFGKFFYITENKEVADLAKGTIPLRNYWAFLATASEVFIGIGLLFSKTQKLAFITAAVLHTLILIAIGPFGYNWNKVVWPWNIEMLVIVALLAFNKNYIEFNGIKTFKKFYKSKIVLLSFILFGIAPVLNYFGWWDTYLSFNLYSGNNNQAIYYFSGIDNDFVKPEMAKFTYYDPNVKASYIDIDKWAMEDLEAPFYPEKRYYKLLGKKLCNCAKFPNKAGLKIFIKQKFTSTKRYEIYPCNKLIKTTN